MNLKKIIASVILTFATHTTALTKAKHDEGRYSNQLGVNDFKSQKPIPPPFPSSSMSEPFHHDSTKGLSEKEDMKALTSEKEGTLRADASAQKQRIVKRGVKGYGCSHSQHGRTHPGRWWMDVRRVESSTGNVGQQGQATSNAGPKNGIGSLGDGQGWNQNGQQGQGPSSTSQRNGVGSFSNDQGLNQDSASAPSPEGMEMNPSGRGNIILDIFGAINPVTKKYGFERVKEVFCAYDEQRGGPQYGGQGGMGVSGIEVLQRGNAAFPNVEAADDMNAPTNSGFLPCPVCECTDTNGEARSGASVLNRGRFPSKRK